MMGVVNILPGPLLEKATVSYLKRTGFIYTRLVYFIYTTCYRISHQKAGEAMAHFFAKYTRRKGCITKIHEKNAENAVTVSL